MNRVRSTLTAAAPADPAFDLLIDDLIARVQSGEAVDWSAVERAHPEHAERLRSMVPALEALGDLPGQNSSAACGLAGDDNLIPGVLGDFRIFREVGRGGMGVVYEAEQVSLGRRVALKVLPFAATMDPKHLQRFKNEAKAAASLRHEHIVHVYGVGCERGVHYYAMEFIDGQTLAQIIAGRAGLRERPVDSPAPATGPYHGESHKENHGALTRPRSPDSPTAPIAALSTERGGPKGREFYRTAAGLIAQAADALEHAHGLGIVHRDVKPANLLVDAAGKLYVSDFGLARFGPDAGLTVSGDLLGTLRYMAPEQALARHGLVDHRADVYALGATLYELLTGRPAVDVADRAEILRQIAFEDPTPPRRLDKAIPAELETMALKCLAKDPVERYATAKDLADDLRRFLDDTPIRAKPPTPREKLGRWVWRHRSVVRWGVVLLALVTAGSVVATALVVRERSHALRERDEAVAQRKRAAGAAELFAMRLGITRWEDEAEVGLAEQRQLYEGAVEFYRELVEQAGRDPGRREEAVLAGRRLARLRNDFAWFLVRQPAASADDVRRGRELVEQAVPQDAENWRFRNTLGVVHYRAGAYQQAIDCLEHSVRLRGGLDGYNGFFLAMAHARLGRADEARRWFDQAAEWTEKSYPKEAELLRFRAEAAALLGIANHPRQEQRGGAG